MIGKRIQRLRTEKSVSLSELADRAGVAKSYLSAIERGIQKNPSIQFLEKIAGVLEIHVEDLLQTDESPEQQLLDREWIDLAKEAMASGVSKEQFREFLEFNRWRVTRNDEDKTK